MYDWFPSSRLMVVPPPVDFSPPGIHHIRQHIVDAAREIGEDYVVMCDDDLQFAVRVSTFETALRPADSNDVGQMMRCLDMYMTDDSDRGFKYAYSGTRLKFGMVGISARQGNHLIEGLASWNSRIIRMFAINLSVVPHHIRFDRIRVMEDFDFQLQLLKIGIPTANIGMWCQDQKMTNAPGGCSTYRTQDIQTEAAFNLQALHGDHLVAVREKHNKTGGDFGHRTEVTIRWKKAFEEGFRT